MIKRNVEKHLARLAQQYPVVTITGPRQSGKTTLCKSLFSQYEYANLEDLETRQLALNDPKGFLAQFKGGVVLDEIQRTPDLPSYIQVIVDEVDKPGQFILTGSQQFDIANTINQSLAGRTALLQLLPFSINEIYPKDKRQNITAAQIIYKGFYPRIHDKNLNPTEALSFYLSTYVERDIRSLVNIKDLSTFERFLKICASQVGQLMNYTRISNDCGIDQSTVKAWLTLLKASSIVYEIPPHFQNFRKRLTKSNKLYFYDVGLACYLLGISSPEQVDAHPMKGALFENLIISEFVKHRFNNVKASNLYFFRDHVGNEVDLILDFGSSLISFEIKSGITFTNNFVKGLNFYHKLSKEINESQYVIYGGSKKIEYQGINVTPYLDLESIFESLPK